MFNVGYNKGGLGQETSRQPSPSLWGDCPVSDLRDSMPGWVNVPQGGVIEGDDFTQKPLLTLTVGTNTAVDRYSAWGGTTTVVALAPVNEEGGVVSLLGATTAGTQAVLASATPWIRLVGPSTAYALLGGKFWAEWRVALGSITASQNGMFVGITDNTSAPAGASARVLAAGGDNIATVNNMIGFVNRTATNPTDWSVAYVKAAGSVVLPTGLTTCCLTTTGLAAPVYAASSPVGQGTGFVKLGMKFDFTVDNPAIPCVTATQLQTAGTLYRPIITFYVNGQRLPTFLTGVDIQAASFPTNVMFAPVIAYDWQAGTTPNYVDWWYAAQLASF